MKNPIRVLAALLVATAFGSITAEADAPRSECIDMDPSVLSSEGICLPHMGASSNVRSIGIQA